MRVWLALPDRMGCGHYRAIWPGMVQDEIEVEYRETLPAIVTPQQKVVALQPVPADVFVLSRPMRRLNIELIELMQAQGIAVVVDVDDDMECLHPKHMGYRSVRRPEANKGYLRKACAQADLVTVTTEALAKRYGSHGRVVVLPNYVPQAFLGVLPSRPRDGRTVGWGGHVGTHPVDLLATRGGVGNACREMDARFVNVGDLSGAAITQRQLELDGVEFESRGAIEFIDYPHELATFDVGIAPLTDSRFNEAKSALKGLEMAAVGVPFVASPTADYQRIAKDGIGLLAGPRRREWKRAVIELLRNRDEHAEAMREGVKGHLLEDHGWRWAEAWETALEHRRSKPTQILRKPVGSL